MRYFPFIYALFVFVLACNLSRPAAVLLHGDEPDHRDLRDGGGGSDHGCGDRLCAPWAWLFEAVLSIGHSVAALHSRGPDRDHVVSHSPVQPWLASVRQHARGPSHSRCVCELRRRPCRARNARHHRRRRAVRRSGCDERAGAARRLPCRLMCLRSCLQSISAMLCIRATKPY